MRYMTFDSIETRIRNRQYQSPSRARAAVSRSHLKARQKDRLTELCDVWEGESTNGATVGGPPENGEAHAAELVDPKAMRFDAGNGGMSNAAVVEAVRRQLDEPELDPPFRVHLNARVRVRLTPCGVAILHGARHRVKVPEDLIDKRGVWETELWTLMSAMGPSLEVGDAPIVDNTLEVLLPRA